MRVLELRDSTGFALEALLEFSVRAETLGKNLDGYCTVETSVTTAVYLAHSSCTSGRQDLVWS